jgi:hypothetical protein
VPHLPFSIIFLACVNGPDRNIVLQKRRIALSVFRVQTPLRQKLCLHQCEWIATHNAAGAVNWLATI